MEVASVGGEDSGPHTAPPGVGLAIYSWYVFHYWQTHDYTQPCRRGMEGLPTFRHGVQLLSSTDP